MFRVTGFVLSAALLIYANGEPIMKQNSDELILSCEVKGSRAISWKVNGQTTSQTSSRGSGTMQNSTLVVKNLTIEDGGVYECFDADSLINSFDVVIISISGENSSLVGNLTIAHLRCTVDNENINVSSLSWRRKEQTINSTAKYTISTTNLSTYLSVNATGTEDAGLYQCVVGIDDMDREFEHSFSINTAAKVEPIEKLKSKVEGDKALIECKVSGFPTPEIKWYKQLEDQTNRDEVKYDKRVNTTVNKAGVPDAILVIRDLAIGTDRGTYTCVATNFLGSADASALLKVKDKLAAVWPFLGICAEVAILCSIIFIFEKRRNRKMEEEEEVDAVKQDLMNQADGAEEKDVRQRAVAKA